jgi:hypothetical protein
MSRPRWPDSHQQPSRDPGTVQIDIIYGVTAIPGHAVQEFGHEWILKGINDRLTTRIMSSRSRCGIVMSRRSSE